MNTQKSSKKVGRLGVLVLLMMLIATTTASISAGPATASITPGKTMKGSTRCIGSVVRRCVSLQAYYMNGVRKVRAYASSISKHDLSFVDHVSLYRNSDHVTKADGEAGGFSDGVATHGTHTNGQYHALAKFCWKPYGSHQNYHCSWLEGGSRYFRH